ncbi:MAG: zinc metallopeptidase [Bacteroidaceae bacterium]|nr:zinc metallopeptidase [Bacteroidaceae bacterium]MBR5963188.1 zinc metallopeptidase [Bacteroidaceae bacterium]
MFIYILFIAIAILSYIVQASLQSRFKKYSQEPIASGMTGRDVALKMMHDNGINDVEVSCISGTLTDHYDPTTRRVNLSQDVYSECSVAAAAVAAHECGHVVQHATGYAPLKLRSSLVPVVSFSSKIVSWVLLAGIILVQAFPVVLEVGIALFALTTLFSIVTLPVEINASKRALAWLDHAGITSASNHRMAESALRSAAYTYVVAALSSLATLVYYLLILNNRRS